MNNIHTGEKPKDLWDIDINGLQVGRKGAFLHIYGAKCE